MAKGERSKARGSNAPVAAGSLDVGTLPPGRLERLLASTPVVSFCCTADQEFATTFISANVEAMFGYHPEQFYADKRFWSDRLHPDDAERVWAAYERLFIDHEVRAEYRFLRADGTYRWVEESARLVVDQTGQPAEVVGFWRDVEARREHELLLQESEERYRSLVEHLPVGVYRTSLDGGIVAANEVMAKLLGFPRAADVIGHNLLDFFVESAERSHEVASGRSGSSAYTEYQLRRADGEVIWVRDHPHPVAGSDGVTACFDGVLVDITERKEVELALERGRSDAELRVVERTAELRQSNAILAAEIADHKRVERRLTALNECMVGFGSDPDANIARMMIVTGELMGATCALYARPTENELAIIGLFGGPSDFDSVRASIETLCRDALRSVTEDLFVVRNLSRTEYKSPPTDSGQWQPQSFVGHVVKTDGATVGVLGVLFRTDYSPPPEDRWLVGIVASAIAVEEQRRHAGVALRESEKKYRQLFERASDIVVIIEPRTERILEANVKACETYGLPREQLIGRSLKEFTLDIRRGELEIERLLQERTLQNFETVHMTKDGEPIYCLANGSVIDYGGREAIFGIIRDVSEQRKTQESLWRRDALLEAVAFAAERLLGGGKLEDQVSEVMARLGEAGQVSRVYLFERHQRADGVWLVSQTCEWVAPGIDSHKDVPLLHDMVYEESPFARWVGIMSSGGVVADPVESLPEPEQSTLTAFGVLSVCVVPIFVDQQAWGLIGFDDCRIQRTWSLAEIEALKAAASVLGQAIQRQRFEDALTESEERYRGLVEMSPDGIGVLVDGCVVLANTALAQIFGLADVQDAIGRSIFEVLREDQREKAAARIASVLESGSRLPVTEYEGVRPDGRTLFIESSASPFVFKSKPAVQIMVRDITERKELQAQLIQAQKMEMVGQLAAGVAHDFNNLLQGLLSSFEVQRERARVKRGAALARQLLLFSRPEVAHPESIDLIALIDEDALFLRRLLREQVHLEVEQPAGPLWVFADRGQLEQVVVNLVVNAQDAMPHGGTLTIRSGLRGADWVFLEVTDTGSGISEDVRARIFEPFFTTKPKGKGTGLGLAVVHGIIDNHNGRIEVESQLGVGSTFTVLLPASKGQEVGVERGPVLGLPRPLAAQASVLLVEDEVLAREGLRAMLEILGFEVVAFASAEEAEEAAQVRSFTLLLTDLGLPGIDGEELARRLRGRDPMVKVIVMSGYAEDEILARSARQEGVRYLEKPLDMDMLTREIGNALGLDLTGPVTDS
jgi:two-component system cell cycle sensor histidine kinase/response regulator CckA